MEIDELDYEKKPFNSNKLYEIHSLTSNGFFQYINNDSYTHKYLEKKAPKLIKKRQHTDDSLFYSTSKPNFFSLKKYVDENEMSNLNKSRINEISYENKQLQENNIEAHKSQKNNNEVIHNEEQQFENKDKNYMFDLNPQTKTLNNFYHNNSKENNFQLFAKNNAELNNNNYENKINNQKKLLKPKNVLSSNNLSSNKHNLKKLSAFLMSSDHSLGLNNQNRKTKSVQKNPNERDFSISTKKSFFFQKSNLDPLSRRLNITASNFRKTVNTDDDYRSNSRFDQNYLNNLNLFIKSKSYFDMDKIIETDSYNKKRYLGFQSYNIPHLEKLTKNNHDNNKVKKPINLLTEKIARSCVGNKKISCDLSQSPEKIREVQEENQKLKKIMMIQTCSSFLKKSKLPEIQDCISQPKLRIKKNDLIGGKIKHMGGKYNPFNFQAGRDCETNRRNQIGALFYH